MAIDSFLSFSSSSLLRFFMYSTFEKLQRSHKNYRKSYETADAKQVASKLCRSCFFDEKELTVVFLPSCVSLKRLQRVQVDAFTC